MPVVCNAVTSPRLGMLSVSAHILPVITYKIKNEYIQLLVPDIEVHGLILLVMPHHCDLITHNLHTMGVDHFLAEAGSTRTNWR